MCWREVIEGYQAAEGRFVSSDNPVPVCGVHNRERETEMGCTDTQEKNSVLDDKGSADKRLETPRPGSKWQHYNGQQYTVLFLTNLDSQYERHPPYVIYQGTNGKLWTRLLSDWHRSFTPIGTAFETWWGNQPRAWRERLSNLELAQIAFESGWEARGEQQTKLESTFRPIE
jgi:hypothetical protein